MYINTLLNTRKNGRGPLPLGVHFRKDKKTNRYTARCHINGVLKHLQHCSTPEEATAIYNKAKGDEVYRVAMQQRDPALRSGLKAHAKLYLAGKVT